MNEEGLLNWENVLTALIGIVIVVFIYLIIYRRIQAKRNSLKQEADLMKSNKEIQNKDNSSHIKKNNHLIKTTIWYTTSKK